MAKAATYLAYDLGAESGRAVAGTIDQGKLRIEAVHRFANTPQIIQGTMYWDVYGLLRELKAGLKKHMDAAGGPPAGVGIDSWGVDFGLLAKDGSLLAQPVCYRDHRNDGVMQKAVRQVGARKIYMRTGIQFMQFNSAYQLYGLKRRTPEVLEAASCLLFMADLMAWFLCGRKANEYTLASTSQLIDPRRRNWSAALMKDLGIPRRIFPELVEAGTVLANVSADIAGGARIPLVAVAHHDTGSAVAAVPAASSTSSGQADWACISCGTWSIVGVELAQPRITDETLACNFTNEGGVCGTTRFMKNLSGLWPLQRCRAKWAEAQPNLDYPAIARAAAAARPFAAIIDIDHQGFINPPDMPLAVKDYCVQTGQQPPADMGEMARAILEGLALGYRRVLDMLERLTGRTYDSVNIVGGGTQNELLMQFAASAMGRPVVAGPVEATAIGNILLQAIATRRIASLAEGRAMVRRSFPLKTYEPRDAAAWSAAYEKFKKLL